MFYARTTRMALAALAALAILAPPADAGVPDAEVPGADVPGVEVDVQLTVNGICIHQAGGSTVEVTTSDGILVYYPGVPLVNVGYFHTGTSSSCP